MIEQTHLTYLYCVANREPKLEQIEALASDIHCISHNGLYAVAGRVERREFSVEGLRRNMNNFQWIKYMVGTHERIIERVAMDADIIPFRFGTLFNTDGSLNVMLEQHEDEFEAIFDRLTNKQEWGLKIYCDPVKLKAGLFGNRTKFLEIEDEIENSSAGKAYFLRKKKEAMIQKRINEKISLCNQEIFETLKDLSSDACITRILPKEVTEREDEMVLNAAFLVDKDGMDDFLKMAHTLKAHYESDGFLIDCTGPWPPYNFCGLSKMEKTG